MILRSPFYMLQKRKHLILFLIIGIITVAIDYLVYIYLFHNFFRNSISKSIGFLSGTLFSFYANKKYNYKIEGKTFRYLSNYLLLYFGTMTLNVFVNKYLLIILSNHFYRIQISFLIATTISASINYLGMNFLVFKKNN